MKSTIIETLEKDLEANEKAFDGLRALDKNLAAIGLKCDSEKMKAIEYCLVLLRAENQSIKKNIIDLLGG
jgi:hypothetical protein